jgi:hypothetical protein
LRREKDLSLKAWDSSKTIKNGTAGVAVEEERTVETLSSRYRFLESSDVSMMGAVVNESKTDELEGGCVKDNSRSANKTVGPIPQEKSSGGLGAGCPVAEVIVAVLDGVPKRISPGGGELGFIRLFSSEEGVPPFSVNLP